MGIKPTGGGLPALSLDTRQELADDLRVSADEVGTRVGQVQSEIYATAKSANDSAQELAGRVKALEGAVSGPRVIPWSGVGTMPSIPAGCRLLNQKTGELWAP